MKKYHVPIGPLRQIMSQAWAVAMQAEIEEEIASALFRGVQTHVINSEADVIKIFERYGINAEKYHQILKHADTQAFIQRQKAAIISLNVHAVPEVYITGDKLLRTERILQKYAEPDRFAAAYIEAIDDIIQHRNSYPEL